MFRDLEASISRRDFLRRSAALGAGLLGVSALVACGDKPTAGNLNVTEQVKLESLGISGNCQIIDIRTLPGFENAGSGYVVSIETIDGKEQRRITFAWKTNLPDNQQLIISDIPLDKVAFDIHPEDNGDPFVAFAFSGDLLNYPNSNNPNRFIDGYLKTATFSFSEQDLRSFGNPQV